MRIRSPTAVSRNCYPRPPRGGRREPVYGWQISQLFLSTPSARRATRHRRHRRRVGSISIHALREEGDQWREQRRFRPESISIHALREEGDKSICTPKRRRKKFLSTPSARRATRKPDCSMGDIPYFYPRPPRGGRPKSCGSSAPRLVFLSTPSARRATTATTSPSPAARFLSTPSARRATCRLQRHADGLQISIHALREEGDSRGRH